MQITQLFVFKRRHLLANHIICRLPEHDIFRHSVAFILPNDHRRMIGMFNEPRRDWNVPVVHMQNNNNYVDSSGLFRRRHIGLVIDD